MAEQQYAIVFRRDFAKGEHWNDRAPADDPDRLQDWKAGDLYSTGTVLPDTLPAHLEAIPIDPPEPGARWDRDSKAFVPFTVEEKEAQLQAAIDHLIANADLPDDSKSRVLSSSVTVQQDRAQRAGTLDSLDRPAAP